MPKRLRYVMCPSGIRDNAVSCTGFGRQSASKRSVSQRDIIFSAVRSTLQQPIRHPDRLTASDGRGHNLDLMTPRGECRSDLLGQCRRDYIAAARAVGSLTPRFLLTEIMPDIFNNLIVVM